MPTLVSFLPSDLARTRGGAERYAFKLHEAVSEALPEWQMRALVVDSSAGAVYTPAGWSAARSPFSRLRGVGDALGALSVAGAAMRDADVVLAHGWRTRMATTLRALQIVRRRQQLVAFDHGAGTRLGYALSWIPLPGADVSAHQGDFAAGLSPVKSRRAVVVRGGIDGRLFVPDATDSTEFDFLMVGRFLPYKGQLRFLQQLPEGATARLIGPADSTDVDYLAAVRETAARRGVPIAFDVSDQELAAAYRGARYTVQVPVDPRRYEGAAPPELMGLTMLEAMASGSVPICPAGGASAEFVRDSVTGLTYEESSEQSLAAVLHRALKEQGVRARLRDGALAEGSRWSWSAAAQTLVNALEIS